MSSPSPTDPSSTPRPTLDEATPRPWRAWDKRGRALWDKPESIGGRITGYTGEDDHGIVVQRNGFDYNFRPPTAADGRLIVEAVNAYDRLRAIEAAARALFSGLVAVSINAEDAAWAALREALDPDHDDHWDLAFGSRSEQEHGR